MTVIFMNRWLQRYLLLGIYIYIWEEILSTFKKKVKYSFFRILFLKTFFGKMANSSFFPVEKLKSEKC